MEADRKKEVINACLDLFIEKGLTETSTRNLSSALKLQSGGLYYYFSNKDEAVILCAEEAAVRLESALITPALKALGNPDLMVKRLKSRADEMTPTMRFLVSVCVNSRYKDTVKPVIDRLSERYIHYAEKFAKKLGCSTEEIAPFVYMTITAVSNYMIFGEETYVAPVMDLVKKEIKELMLAQENAG